MHSVDTTRRAVYCYGLCAAYATLKSSSATDPSRFSPREPARRVGKTPLGCAAGGGDRNLLVTGRSQGAPAATLGCVV